MSFRPADLVEMLRARAAATPEATAYILLEEDGSERRLSYGELDTRARATAAAMQQQGTAGGRALLLYPPGEEYIVGFFGCLYSGTAAVPVYPPSGKRGLDRLMDIVIDAEATVALTDDSSLQLIQAMGDSLGALSELAWTATDIVAREASGAWAEVAPGGDALAFLQYTSGSTGSPKGVVLRHANLIENSRTIARANGSTRDSVGVSWLPPYHDMGLIGGILQPLYSGFPCVLMAPMTFLRRPLRWLDAISRHGGTMSAAPDFAYAECVRRVTEEEAAGLDLSSWEHAMIGAEPVRSRTLDDFERVFGPAGFRRSSFHPCYGLAEATLFVTGGKPGAEPLAVTLTEDGPKPPAEGAAGTTLIGCGDIQGEDSILVVDPQTLLPVGEGGTGEVWVAGKSVAQGYWRRPELTESTFRAELAEPDGRTYLRTGDLAFRHQGELFITGRIKDLIVVRGRNHYPQDIEYTAELSHELLVPNRAAAFGLDDGTGESVVLLHEVSRKFRDEDADAVLTAIRTAVTVEHGLALHDIVLVRMGALPRTSSGKIRRRATRERYTAGDLQALANGTGSTPVGDSAVGLFTDDPIGADVLAKAADALGTTVDRISATRPLVVQGLDSLHAVRLRSALEAEHGVEVPLTALLGETTVSQLADLVRSSGTGTPGAAITRRTTDADAPPAASFGQERLWLLDRLGAGSAYHVAGGLRISGALDVPVLERAVGEVIARHESLRTRFAWTDEGLRQIVDPTAGVPVPVVDVPGGEAGVTAWLDSQTRQPFDLAAGPLVRVAVGRVGAGEWAVGLVAHHAVVDGWSLGIVLRELGLVYGAFTSNAEVSPLPELDLRYGDFAAWQRETLEGDALEAGLDHWKTTLDGATGLELPAKVSRSDNHASYELGVLPVAVPAVVVEQLRGVVGVGRATVFQGLLASFASVAGRWS
ncbi:AMP-binding protein, partial [Streptomyces sp. NPDC060000]|uniref:AMP-binding protein n=1 Tax=Streptomyces sp. NPDC060000 TaxID=3347031 RepID=UPI0036A79259